MVSRFSFSCTHIGIREWKITPEYWPYLKHIPSDNFVCWWWKVDTDFANSNRSHIYFLQHVHHSETKAYNTYTMCTMYTWYHGFWFSSYYIIPRTGGACMQTVWEKVHRQFGQLFSVKVVRFNFYINKRFDWIFLWIQKMESHSLKLFRIQWCFCFSWIYRNNFSYWIIIFFGFSDTVEAQRHHKIGGNITHLFYIAFGEFSLLKLQKTNIFARQYLFLFLA